MIRAMVKTPLVCLQHFQEQVISQDRCEVVKTKSKLRPGNTELCSRLGNKWCSFLYKYLMS